MSYQHKDETTRFQHSLSEEIPSVSTIDRNLTTHYGEKEGHFKEPSQAPKLKEFYETNAIEDSDIQGSSFENHNDLYNQRHVNDDPTKPTLRDEYIDSLRDDRARKNEILRQEIIKKREQELLDSHQRQRPAPTPASEQLRRRDQVFQRGEKDKIDKEQMSTEYLNHYGLQAVIMKENNPNLSEQEIIKRIHNWQVDARNYLNDGSNTMSKEMEDILVIETYFNRNELALLFREFTTYTKGSLYMSKPEFQDFLSIFQESNGLTESLLCAIDENGDGDIAFPEFVYALSIMARGSIKEKLRFTFLICDFDRNGMVSREEVYTVVSTMSRIFSQLPFTKDRYILPHETVTAVFNGGLNMNGSGYLQEKNELDVKEFIDRGMLGTDISGCFGMFDFFYFKFVLPFDEMFKGDKISMGGMLTKIKNISFLHIHSVHHRRLKIKDGFLIIYQRGLDWKYTKPTRAIFLPGSTVHVLQDYQKRKKFSTKYQSYHGFKLTSGDYSRYFFVNNQEEADDWVNALRHYSRIGYRFESFAQPQPNNNCQWFVNGVNYYRELARCIDAAKYEILIAGWWVWPYVILDRDTPERMENTRLDRILTRKAKEGVKVRVLMWNETNLGIQLGTKHSSHWLENCHPNISVIRHPKIYPLSWSHHQKSVIIDQAVGFVGGIDICFMRYETDDFPLLDLDSKVFPGKDYGNICSIVTRTGNPHKDQLDRHEVPRMPWHDCHIKVVGLSAKDLAANFIQRWNHAKFSDKRSNWGKEVLLPKDYFKENKKVSKNGFVNAFSNLKRNVTNIGYGQEKRTVYHRPAENPEIRKYASNQAKNFDKPLDNNIGYDGVGFDELKDEDYDNQSEGSAENPMAVSTPGSLTANADTSGCLVQIVRSACKWSVGIDTESSCYKAFFNTIRNAKHFVYIQNLFFVSSCGARLPKNRIAFALLQRIRHAIIHKTNFKVIVVTSINAGGDIRDTAARVVIGWTQRTINKGGQSIVELLQQEFPDVDISQYFGVYSLRKWELCYDRIYTEQIYIHSKVLIADDKVTIVGSCNINDRSMMGVRDSELAAVVTDGTMVESKMDGKPFMAGQFARSLRLRLWKLHLGLSDSEVSSVMDPVDSYSKIWAPTAKNNSRVYKEAFGDLIPENQVRLPPPEDPILRYTPKTDNLLSILSGTKGCVIEFPLNMYSESDLTETKMLTPEHYVNTSVFI